MSGAELFRMLTSLAIILVAATTVGSLFSRLRQPRVVGEIIGGLLLGPSVLGHFAPQATDWIYPAQGATAGSLQMIYQLGMLMLMFAAGCQMRATFGKADLGPVTVVAAVGMIGPGIVALVLAESIDLEPLHGTAHQPVALTLILVCSMAITSLPVISRIFLDLELMHTRFARLVLSVAAIEDIFLNVALAVALGMANSAGGDHFGLMPILLIESTSGSALFHAVTTVAFLGLVVMAVASPRAQRLSSRVVARGGVAGFLMALLLVSGACVFLGIAPIFGALALGILIGHVAGQRDDAPLRTLFTFGTATFVPMYFALVGIRLNLMTDLVVTLTLGFIALACATKCVSVYVSARIVHIPRRGATNLAVALNARGGPGILIATLAFDAHIISAALFTSLILAAIFTSLLAGTWLERARHGGDLLAGIQGPPPERSPRPNPSSTYQQGRLWRHYAVDRRSRSTPRAERRSSALAREEQQ